MIIVHAKAVPKGIESQKKIIEFAQDLITNTRNEDGNIDYNLLINPSDDSLLFVEMWESKEILDKHLKTEHFIKFGENIEDLVASELVIDVFDADYTSL